MKKLGISLLVAMVLQAGTVNADTVIKEVPDTLPGKGFGGISGFMTGAAAGGPIGAIIGIGLGWLGGGAIQEAAGSAGKGYHVRREDGSETVIRSPNHEFSPGDRVKIVGNRLVADRGGESQQPATLSQR